MTARQRPLLARLTSRSDSMNPSAAGDGRQRASVVAEPEFQILIERLTAESAQFASLWRQREIVAPIPLAIELNHPRFGQIAVHSLRVPIDRGGGAMLLFLAPADEVTERAFGRVALELRQEIRGAEPLA